MKKKLLTLALCSCAAFGGAAATTLLEDNFEFAPAGPQLPSGYQPYRPVLKGRTVDSSLLTAAVAETQGRKEIVLEDNSSEAGTGLTRTFPATAGKGYRLKIEARPLDGRSAAGFSLQLRGRPSNRFLSLPINAPQAGKTWTETEVSFRLPAGDKQITCYLFSTYQDRPAIAVREFELEELEAGEPVEVFDEDFDQARIGDPLPPRFARFFASLLPKSEAASAKVRTEVIAAPDGDDREVLLEDRCSQSGVGLTRAVNVPPGTYRVTAEVRPLPGESLKGMLLQLRGIPSKKMIQQQIVNPPAGETYGKTAVTFSLPEGDKAIQLYLYSTYKDNPVAAVGEIKLESVTP